MFFFWITAPVRAEDVARSILYVADHKNSAMQVCEYFYIDVQMFRVLSRCSI